MKNDTRLKQFVRKAIDDKKEGCGYSRIWLTAPGDPFYPACELHDEAYKEGSMEQTAGKTRKWVDLRFYGQMLEIAGDDRKLRLRAYFYYSIVRALGWSMWEGV